MKRLVAISAVITAICVVSVTLLANVSGAIFTTVASGTTVNGNIYDNKADVYLNGGPQNDHGSLLSPDGLYYFQVTDPSGAVLLSTDDLACRVVRVADGRITAAEPSECAHAMGSHDDANGTTPVQLMPFNDTPNPGGEYKAWMTPVEAYGVACQNNQGSFGFCDSESKTDNFKVTASAVGAAQITVCKFNDFNANGVRDGGEPTIAHWPITAKGVDGGTVEAQTGDDGCTAFTFSGFTATNTEQTVTLSEGTFGKDWQQTAPANDGGVITLTVHPGDVVAAPSFGNTNPFCQEGCVAGGNILTAKAYPSLSRTFDWTIAKDADQSRIVTASTQATVNYTVTVTHDAGTDSDWTLTGDMTVANPGGNAITNMTITAEADGGQCVVSSGDQVTIAAGTHADFQYSCAFATAPAAGAVQLRGTWADGQLTATAPFDFASAVVKGIDDQVTVTDSMVGELAVLTSTSPSPSVLTYGKTLTGIAGTCTTTNNTATMLKNTSAATESASRSVQMCVGANLTMSQTASSSFTSSIAKTVERATIEQQGGSVTFNYSVSVTESGWRVAGIITVTNPNDWQDVTADVAATLPGASCTVSSPMVTVPSSSSVGVPYACDFSAVPAATTTATSQLTWDATAASTPGNTLGATATSSFAPLTVVDSFNGAAATTLGTIPSPAATTSYAYPKTVANAAAGTCQPFTNSASIDGTSQSASQTAYACNTLTGARTIGFWQNKNGQAIITGGASSAGVCNAATWLRAFAPFQDLAATATCKTVASYATTLIKNASAAGASMNAMLKAQMLASALNVFFSDAANGNTLAALTSVGGVRIDLSKFSGAFNGATSLTVLQLLQFQNGVSNAGGTTWYGQNKIIQEFAKSAFDAINNEVAPIAQ